MLLETIKRAAFPYGSRTLHIGRGRYGGRGGGMWIIALSSSHSLSLAPRVADMTSITQWIVVCVRELKAMSVCVCAHTVGPKIWVKIIIFHIFLCNLHYRHWVKKSENWNINIHCHLGLRFFNVFERSLLCWPRLHLFDQRYKNCDIGKYYFNLK